MTKRYDHAFSLAFSVISDREDASDVTHEMLLQGLLKRLMELTESHRSGPQGESLVDACDAPFDTMEEGA
jgi:hypothetical protein